MCHLGYHSVIDHVCRHCNSFVYGTFCVQDKHLAVVVYSLYLRVFRKDYLALGFALSPPYATSCMDFQARNKTNAVVTGLECFQSPMRGSGSRKGQAVRIHETVPKSVLTADGTRYAKWRGNTILRHSLANHCGETIRVHVAQF